VSIRRGDSDEPINAASTTGEADQLETLPDAAGLEWRPSGQDFGARYRLLAEVGHGGFGLVFRARDQLSDEVVAIKILTRTDAHTTDTIARFRRELRAARKVTHPGVVRIHDLIEVEGHLALSMEFIEGETLAARLERGPVLTSDELADLGMDLARALAAAHRAGVTHRDLKPENIILRAGSGRAVITDFGVSRLAEASDPRLDGTTASQPLSAVNLTRTGDVLGTPLYMAPEQLLGRADVGPAVDLYALGVVLFEAATGRTPHVAPTLNQLLKQKLEQPAPAVESLRPEIAKPLARIIDRCLAKDPGTRFSDALELRTALGRVRHPGRRRVLGLAGGLALLAAAATLTWSLTHRWNAGAAWRPALTALSTVDENMDKPAISPDGRFVAVTSNRNGHWDIWLVDIERGAWTPLTNDVPPDEEPQFIAGGREVLFFSNREGRSGLWSVPVDLSGPPRFIMEMPRSKLSATADGRTVLFAPSSREVALLDLTTMKTRVIYRFPANEGFTGLTISADGRRALIGVERASEGGFTLKTRSDLFLLSTVTGEGRYITSDSEFNAIGTFVPDDPNAIVISSHRGGTQALWKFFLDGRPPLQLTNEAGGDDIFPVMSPDGKRLIFMHDLTLNQLYVREQAGAAWRPITRDLFDHTSPTLDATGHALVYATHDHDTGVRQLWRAEAPAFDSPNPVGSLTRLLEPALSADGQEIVATRLEGEVRSVVRLTEKGTLMEIVTPSYKGTFCGGATVSPDRQRVAFARDGDELGLYVVPAGEDVTRTPPVAILQASVCYARFSPRNPNLLAYLRRTSPGRGRLELLDLASHSTRSVFEVPLDSARLSWDPDGSAIYVYEDEKRVIKRVRLADSAVTDLVEAPGDDSAGFAAGPDGLLVAEGTVGRTRMLSIENIGSTPR
jgi:serine/threonine protein kinase